MRDIFCLRTALSSEMPSLRRLFLRAAFFLMAAGAGSPGGAGTNETWAGAQSCHSGTRALNEDEITEIRIRDNVPEGQLTAERHLTRLVHIDDVCPEPLVIV